MIMQHADFAFQVYLVTSYCYNFYSVFIYLQDDFKVDSNLE